MPSFATQTSYSAFPAKGVPGQRANMEVGNVLSRTVENAAGIPFGAPVARGSDDHGIIPFVSGGRFLGFAMKTTATEHPRTGAFVADTYQQWTTANVMERGQIYQRTGAAVADGDAVYWDAANNRYTNVASGNLAIPNAFFDTSTTGVGQIAEVSLRNRSA